MRVIVGLGNPGKKYQKTRHNVGFLAIERIAKAWGIPIRKERYHSLTGEGVWEREPVLLALPQTFMNASGEAVKEIIHSTPIAVSELMVVCDDMALPVGYARLRAKGSAGGHQGLTSIIETLGSEYFNRLRIGIGSAGQGADTSEYVLATFAKMEWEKIHLLLDRIPEVCQIWIEQGIQKAMSYLNKKVKGGIGES